MTRGRAHALVGSGGWLAWMLASRPALLSEAWADALVLFAALVVVPLGFVPTLERRRSALARGVVRAQPLSALSLIASHALDRGALAVALALPWLCLAACAALDGLLRLRDPRERSAARLAHAFALIYFPIGAVWLLFARYGARPLGFSDSIVRLTAAHFHYAGFALPIAAGCSALALARFRTLDRAAVGLVIAGVPLVAIGITATQLGTSAALEPVAAWTMAAGGALTAWLELSVARADPRRRTLLLVSAIALGFGMLLAALYGARFFVPIAALDIPWMRALHGTANALGFSLPALVAFSSADDAGRSGADPERADEDHDRDGGGGERDEQHDEP